MAASRCVFPEDVIVADEDGAVVIPSALLNDVVEAAVEQEKLEEWILGEVQAGLPPGLTCASKTESPV